MALKKVTQAGDLDRKIDILEPSNHVNGKGETVGVSDSPVAMGIWANRQSVSGDENDKADRNTALATDLFTIRYRTGITEKMTLVYEGKSYDILNVSEGEGRKQWTEIKARKRD